VRPIRRFGLIAFTCRALLLEYRIASHGNDFYCTKKPPVWLPIWPTLFQLDEHGLTSKTPVVVVVEIGGTKIAAGLVHNNGHILTKAQCPTLPQNGTQPCLKTDFRAITM
jgi:hypothetical protein